MNSPTDDQILRAERDAYREGWAAYEEFTLDTPGAMDRLDAARAHIAALDRRTPAEKLIGELVREQTQTIAALRCDVEKLKAERRSWVEDGKELEALREGWAAWEAGRPDLERLDTPRVQAARARIAALHKCP